MDLISLAREIGFAIQNDDDYIDYKVTEQNVECDHELQEIIEKFNLKKVEINHEISKETPDTEKIDKLNEEIGSLYREMVSNETMKAYNESKEKFARKLQAVSFIINKSAEGQDPYNIEIEEDNCTGSCATCGGCD